MPSLRNDSNFHHASLSPSEMQAAILKYPKRTDTYVQYGTSGFRTKAELLDHVVFRMGLLATLRSRVVNSSAIGLMITASHNPEGDNGIKLVDPMGEMLDMEWESIASKIANSSDDELEKELRRTAEGFGLTNDEKPAIVLIARDTRPSSLHLSQAAIAGVEAFNGKYIDFGEQTTPILHYVVFAKNKGLASDDELVNNYYKTLSSAFRALRIDNTKRGNYIPEIIFDGANGVGSFAMERFMTELGDLLKVTRANVETGTKGKLNYMCGADYVKTNQTFPAGCDQACEVRIASVDGDADRVVYSYKDVQGQFHLLDGDRIATLVAGYITDLLKGAGINLKLGLVQTAYSNGNSTKYINELLKVPVACVDTGVKYLHHKALEFDIGVYFEANGHGTVVFSEDAYSAIDSAARNSNLFESQKKNAQRLQLLTKVINSTVGDAISDLFLVETVLLDRGWSIRDWENAYVDLPSRLMKVTVKDRNVIKTTDANRRVLEPEGLQDAINSVVSKYSQARSFVRASGTENVVRVYAESATKDEADSLALEVANLVYKMADGVGPAPS